MVVPGEGDVLWDNSWTNLNSIFRLTIVTPNMEMKHALVHLVQNNQFHGLSHENPYNHLATFLEICNTVKRNHVQDNVILKFVCFFLSMECKGVAALSP